MNPQKFQAYAKKITDNCSRVIVGKEEVIHQIIVSFLCGGHGAVCGIPKAMEETVSREDLEGISGFLRSIEGVRISATLREIEGGCKISVRAVPGLDAGRVCTRFGGGGHKGAGGANMLMPMAEAMDVLAAALQNALEEA